MIEWRDLPLAGPLKGQQTTPISMIVLETPHAEVYLRNPNFLQSTLCLKFVDLDIYTREFIILCKADLSSLVKPR